jgi:hypothetical protein
MLAFYGGGGGGGGEYGDRLWGPCGFKDSVCPGHRQQEEHEGAQQQEQQQAQQAQQGQQGQQVQQGQQEQQEQRCHVTELYLSIDQGPIVCLIENGRTGLLWGLFMATEEAGLALASLNMRSSYRGGRAVQESTDAALDIKITS